MDEQKKVPVVTLDGPSGVGKGTLAIRLARHLGWHYLDSGALYRLLAWLAHDRGVVVDDAHVQDLVALVVELDVAFQIDADATHYTTWVHGQQVDQAIRSEQCGQLASQLSAYPAVRAALCDLQCAFAKAPGLVADGRDMGTVIFPDATHKFFLDASCEVRAQRRYLQLSEAGQTVVYEDLLARLQERDRRDRERSASPLRPANDAICIDTTDLSIDALFQQVCEVMGA